MLLKQPLTSRRLSLFLASAALAACNSADPLPTYFDLDYQVGCVLPECSAISHGPARTVMAVDGENGYDNFCAATPVDGVKLVTLRMRNVGNDTGFEISNALYNVDNNVGALCRVKITEGSNTYEGLCSTATPTPAVPCQLTNFRTNSTGALEGHLYCNNVPAGNSPSTTRDIARSGAFNRCTDASGLTVDPINCPATFLAEPCTGL